MLVILLSALAVAADVEPAAKAEPPRILTASVKDGKLVSRLRQNVVVPVTTAQKVRKGDTEEVVYVTSYRRETRTIDLAFDLKKATMRTAGGKKLDLDALKKKLDKPQPVVVSADGREVDESYLKLFDKDVIVIVVPLEELQGPQPPTPKDGDKKDGAPTPKKEDR